MVCVCEPSCVHTLSCWSLSQTDHITKKEKELSPLIHHLSKSLKVLHISDSSNFGLFWSTLGIPSTFLSRGLEWDFSSLGVCLPCDVSLSPYAHLHILLMVGVLLHFCEIVWQAATFLLSRGTSWSLKTCFNVHKAFLHVVRLPLPVACCDPCEGVVFVSSPDITKSSSLFTVPGLLLFSPALQSSCLLLLSQDSVVWLHQLNLAGPAVVLPPCSAPLKWILRTFSLPPYLLITS